MENEILTQLVWIKWFLVVIVAALALGSVAMGIAVRAFAKIPEQMKSDISFPDRARELLDKGKTEEVIGLAEDRISKFPADSQAHWFLGQACYRVGDLRRALICLRKTQELQPDWESTYTGPLIRVIEEKLAKGTPKPGLKVVAPNESFEDAPPDGGAPLNS